MLPLSYWAEMKIIKLNSWTRTGPGKCPLQAVNRLLPLPGRTHSPLAVPSSDSSPQLLT